LLILLPFTQAIFGWPFFFNHRGHRGHGGGQRRREDFLIGRQEGRKDFDGRVVLGFGIFFLLSWVP
jgi:hypothetical protein